MLFFVVVVVFLSAVVDVNMVVVLLVNSMWQIGKKCRMASSKAGVVSSKS